MPIVGFFGGTFDPFHQAHAQLVLAFCEQYQLTSLYIAPTALPHHRQKPSSTPQHRLAMLQLACNTLQNQTSTELIVYDAEIKTNSPGYTIDTLKILRQDIGQDVPLFMLIGADSLAKLQLWKDYDQLLNWAHIVVARRPNTDIEQDLAPEIALLWQTKQLSNLSLNRENSLKLASYGTMSTLNVALLDLSATKIRRYLKQASNHADLNPYSSIEIDKLPLFLDTKHFSSDLNPTAIRLFLEYALDPNVQAYIHTHKLYTSC